MKKPTLGVFGWGQFMRFFTPHLLDFFDIYVYDRNQEKTQQIDQVGATPCNLEEAAGCDFVLLGYPAKYIAELIPKLSPFLQKEVVVFDICSVKKTVSDTMQRLLPENTQIIATHPIFGPQSGKNGIEGLKMTLWNISAQKEVFERFSQIFSDKMKLDVIYMSPEDHDMHMAYIQGITHFIGKTLKKIDIPDSPLATQSYKHLFESKNMVGNDSDALFLSIQSDNPFVDNVREKLMEEFEEIQKWILTSRN